MPVAAAAAVLALLTLGAARADVAPEPMPGQQFASYSVRVEGLDAFPGVVLVLHDKGAAEIYGHRAFTAAQPEHQIANGRSSRGNNISQPDLYVMSQADYDAWAAATSASIARQETACAERQEGCAHISRFVPRYAPPPSAAPCNAAIAITTADRQGGADAFVDTFRLTAAAPGTCTMEPAGRSALRGGQPLPSGSGMEKRCAAVTAAGSASVWGLAMLLAAWRRRQHQ